MRLARPALRTDTWLEGYIGGAPEYSDLMQEIEERGHLDIAS